MKLEFQIAQRKKNTKSKNVVAITDVKVKLNGNKDLINEIYECINKNIVDNDRLIF